MNDLFHYFGNDIQLSATGDIAPIDDTIKGQQRILRRLLTNPNQTDANGNPIAAGDYIWHPTYGAGLPSYVGQIINVPKITALIRSQILLEECVAKMPAPVINLEAIANGLSCTITYTDAISKTPQTLSFDVNK